MISGILSVIMSALAGNLVRRIERHNALPTDRTSISEAARAMQSDSGGTNEEQQGDSPIHGGRHRNK